MRAHEFIIPIFEAEQTPGYYTVGDSHAEGLGAYTGKPWINRAKHSKKSTDPMHMAAINSIPSGSVVVISLGANDASATNDAPAAIASRVASIVNASVAKGNTTQFLLFPIGTSKNVSQERREAVRNAIRSAVTVPITDLEGSSLQSDGVHAQPNVYKSIGKKLSNQLMLPKSANAEKKADAKAQTTTSGQGFNVKELTSNKGPAVADMQKALVGLGYDLPRFGIDGIIGSETKGAISKFQQDNGLPVTGVGNVATVEKLNSVLQSKPEILSQLKPSTSADVKGRINPNSLPPLATDSATTGKIGSVLDLIARYESRGNYNIILGGKSLPLTDMTISQIYDLQRNMIRQGKESSAVGRYQYISKTLKQEVNQLGLDPETTKFDEKTQDKIAIHTLRTTARLDDWLSGKQKDDQFLYRLSKIWASIPNPYTGNSYYAGVGSNKAGINTNVALSALSQIQSATA